jgi:flagellar assembly factor FliW
LPLLSKCIRQAQHPFHLKWLVCNRLPTLRTKTKTSWHVRCLAVRSDMSTLELTELESVRVKKENIIHMPGGLLGFEDIKRFVLLSDPEDAPFSWFQVLDDSTLAFLVLPPFDALPDYQPEISDDDCAYLGIKKPTDALIYNIVTLRGESATINLKGPIVINRFSLRGKQVVLQNAPKYSVRHPLPLANPDTF